MPALHGEPGRGQRKFPPSGKRKFTPLARPFFVPVRQVRSEDKKEARTVTGPPHPAPLRDEFPKPEAHPAPRVRSHTLTAQNRTVARLTQPVCSEQAGCTFVSSPRELAHKHHHRRASAQPPCLRVSSGEGRRGALRAGARPWTKRPSWCPAAGRRSHPGRARAASGVGRARRETARRTAARSRRRHA